MKLFFETSAQATVFLMILPIGMLLAACVDLCACAGTSRPIWDLLVVLLCFVTVGICVVLLNDASLRMYHILSVLAGYLLYAFGIRRLLHVAACGIKRMKKDVLSGRKKREKVE